MEQKVVSVQELQALWQRVPTTPVVISPLEMRTKIEGFRGHIRRRNVKELITWLIAGVPLCWIGSWPISLLWHVSCAVLLLGCAFAAVSLFRRSGPLVRDAPPAAALVQFHRAQLEHERDMLRGMWRWYVLPVMPGIALVAYAAGRFIWPRLPHMTVILGGCCLFLAAALVTLWTIVVQLTWAARLQRRIEDLDRYREA